LSIQLLIEALKSADQRERIHAEHELRLVGDAAFDDLIMLLEDASNGDEARWRAAYLLGVLGDKRAVSVLSAALSDNSSDVQYHAAWALGKLRDPVGFSALEKVLHSTTLEEQANYAAAVALVGIDRDAGLKALQAAMISGNEAAQRVARGAFINLTYFSS
jgi:HEAT repeat protein